MFIVSGQFYPLWFYQRLLSISGVFIWNFADCLSCLSVTLVYCGQTVGWIKMKLGMQVGLVPGHIVLDGDPAPSPRKGHSTPPIFGPYLLWPNGRMGTEPFRSRANSLRGAIQPIGPVPIRSLVLSLPGLFAPWPFRSLELSRNAAIYFLSSKFPGHFAPGSESSRERIGQGAVGRFAPGSELARERKGCESLDALRCHLI